MFLLTNNITLCDLPVMEDVVPQSEVKRLHQEIQWSPPSALDTQIGL